MDHNLILRANNGYWTYGYLKNSKIISIGIEKILFLEKLVSGLELMRDSLTVIAANTRRNSKTECIPEQFVASVFTPT